MTESSDRATLAALVAPSLGLDPSSLRLSRIGTGKHNASYWVDALSRRYRTERTGERDSGHPLLVRVVAGFHGRKLNSNAHARQ